MNIAFNPSQIATGASGSPSPLTYMPGQQPGKTQKSDGFGDTLASSIQSASKSADSTFKTGNLVGEFINQVDSMQDTAAATRSAFISGESGNLHQTMIASQEASVAFSLMVEMRNKVMEGYQELMRIQI